MFLGIPHAVWSQERVSPARAGTKESSSSPQTCSGQFTASGRPCRVPQREHVTLRVSGTVSTQHSSGFHAGCLFTESGPIKTVDGFSHAGA